MSPMAKCPNMKSGSRASLINIYSDSKQKSPVQWALFVE